MSLNIVTQEKMKKKKKRKEKETSVTRTKLRGEGKDNILKSDRLKWVSKSCYSKIRRGTTKTAILP